MKKQVNRLYFLSPTYAIGGGEALLCRLTEFLLSFTKIKVGVIDFKDGILQKTIHHFFYNYDIQYIDYNKDTWKLDDNSCIFVASDRIGCIKQVEGKNITILHHIWNTDTAWEILFEKQTFFKLAKLLNKNNAITFNDFGTYIYAKRVFKQNFKKNYIPVFFHHPETKKYNKKTQPSEINLVWLGRISTTKTISILNICKNFFDYKTNKKKIFHIIGNGTDVDFLKNEVKKYENEIKFIFTGLVTGEELDKYLQENTDIGIAIGTSLMNFAALGLPVIAAHEPDSEKFYETEFIWLFNLFEYSLGTPYKNDNELSPLIDHKESFQSIMKSIDEQKEILINLGEKCKRYYETYHKSLEKIGQLFVNAIENTTFTYDAYKKSLKYIPYNDTGGIYIEKFDFFKLPLAKIIHHKSKIRIYFLGIQVARIISTYNKYRIYILGLNIFNRSRWGRYNFPSVSTKKLKYQAKGKYSISNLVYKRKNHD